MAATTLSAGRLTLFNAPDLDIGLPISKSRPPQAFQINVPEEIVEELSKTSRAGHDIHISFGKTPTLLYGSKSIDLRLSPSRFRSELYSQEDLSSDSLSFTALVSHFGTMSDLKKTPAGTDAALEGLKRSLEAAKKEKQSTQATLVDEVKEAKRISKAFVSKKGAAARTSVFAHFSKTPSMPVSPCLRATGVRTPQPGKALTSAPSSNERLRASRGPLFHLLAVGPAEEDVILKNIHLPEAECLQLLDRYAKRRENSTIWELGDKWFKELDVFRFPYATGTSDRQSAIDNAIRAYDRMRVGKDEEVWQKLLPEKDRGKGIWLSKLHLNKGFGLTQRLSTPKPEARATSPDDKSLSTTEQTANSNPHDITKPKTKTHERDALSKRLLSGRQANRSPARPSKSEENVARPSKAGQKRKAESSKFKSAEIVYDSDSEGDYELNAQVSLDSSPPNAKKTSQGQNQKNGSTSKAPPAATSARAKPTSNVKADATNRIVHSTNIGSDSSSSQSSMISHKSSPLHVHSSSVSSTSSNTSLIAEQPQRKRKIGNSTPSRPYQLSSSPPIATSPATTSKRPAPDVEHSISAQKKPKLVDTPAASKTQANFSSSLDNARRLAEVKAKKRESHGAYIHLHQELSNMDQVSNDKISEAQNLRRELKDLQLTIAMLEKPRTPVDDADTLPSLSSEDIKFLQAEYGKQYPDYKKLHDQLAASTSPSQERIAELLKMQANLVECKKLIENGSTQKTIEKVRRELQINDEEPPITLSRRQTLDLYAKYHSYSAQYEVRNRELHTNPNPTMSDVGADWKMRLRLDEMKKQILLGMQLMARGLDWAATDDGEFANEPVLSEADAREAARNFTEGFPEWWALRSELLSRPWGSVEPSEMAEMWDTQARLKKWRARYYQAWKHYRDVK